MIRLNMGQHCFARGHAIIKDASPAATPTASKVKTKGKGDKFKHVLVKAKATVAECKDIVVTSKGVMLLSKDAVVRCKDAVVKSKIAVRKSKDAVVQSKDAVVMSSATVAECNDTVTTPKGAVISSKDSVATPKVSVTESEDTVVSSKAVVVDIKETTVISKETAVTTKDSAAEFTDTLIKSNDNVVQSADAAVDSEDAVVNPDASPPLTPAEHLVAAREALQSQLYTISSFIPLEGTLLSRRLRAKEQMERSAGPDDCFDGYGGVEFLKVVGTRNWIAKDATTDDSDEWNDARAAMKAYYMLSVPVVDETGRWRARSMSTILTHAMSQESLAPSGIPTKVIRRVKRRKLNRSWWRILRRRVRAIAAFFFSDLS